MFIRGGSHWAFSDELDDGAEAYIRLDDDGRVVELYLTKNGGEITPTDLRRVPLTRLRAQANSRWDLWLAMDRSPDLAADVYAELRRAFPPLGRSEDTPQEEPFELCPTSPEYGLTDAFLQDVARAYRNAVTRGLRPNVALAQQTRHEKRTVEKWVYLARKKGFLEPTRPGSVG